MNAISEYSITTRPITQNRSSLMENVMLNEEGLSQDDDHVINSYNYSCIQRDSIW